MRLIFLKASFCACMAARTLRKQAILSMARRPVSGADRIYVLIDRRPHTGATSQQTDFAG